eukprot:scaffold1.g5264.t1
MVTAELAWEADVGGLQQSADPSLRRLRAEHLKQRGDAAIKDGNYRQAWERYTDAIAVKPDKQGLHLLLGNRSLAYLKAGRHAEALADADAAAALAPQWHKVHWRRGAALLGLRRVPEAVLAFRRAWGLAPSEPETERKLWATVQRLTREQLGGAIAALLQEVEANGGLRPPRVEAVSEAEAGEAWFRLLQAAHRGRPRPGQYYHRYLGWLKEGLPPEEAYIERSAMYCQAKAYLQARADARAAVAALAEQRPPAAAPGGSAPSAAAEAEAAWRRRLAAAYARLGHACLAEQGHTDRDTREAAKAFLKAGDCDPGSQEAKDGLREAEEELSKEALEAVTAEAYQEGAAGGALADPGGLGFAASPAPGARAFVARLRIAFPAAAAADAGARARELLRAGLAAAAGVATAAVALDRVLPPARGRPYLGVEAVVQVGGELLKGSDLVRAVGDPERIQAALGGAPLVELLGPPDPALCSAELEDTTPACAQSAADRAAAAVANEEGGAVAPEEERRLALPARPKLEIELPYRLYRLVRADGSTPERTDKHPFCMSRVYYDAVEKPEELWTELLDGSCRWRQTGSEIKVMVLKVPQDLSPRQLEVAIEPYSIRVAHRGTGEVYLEGELERGVVPHECFWTHCGGEGEDGCMLYLRKMNLELLQRHWQHSEMWWSRLLRCHGEIAWDDYEKDYSDLPEEVLRRHRVAEAIKDDERRAETVERGRREVLQEADDLRKRRRQERLNELRTGSRKDWVTLYRENPGAA